MRTTCPACGSPDRMADWKMEFIVPDGWTLPASSTVCLCLACGLIYYDNDATQADYDRYYMERYGYDGNEHCEANLQRLDELVKLVVDLETPKDALIIDFGGGEGYLTLQLNKLGYARARTVDVGKALPQGIDLLISSQTFEHLYDLRGTVQHLVDCLNPDGRMLIEIPDAYKEPFLPEPPPILDFHQKHINHFIPAVLDHFVESFGFMRTYHHSGETPWYFGSHYRAVYERGAPLDIYVHSQTKVERAIERRVETLRQVRGPVIVWGCGDYCLHLLAKHMPEVAYFVDRDPAYIGQTIRGIPVRQYVTSSEPILVMAQNQKSGILKCIQDEGLTNEVLLV